MKGQPFIGLALFLYKIEYGTACWLHLDPLYGILVRQW